MKELLFKHWLLFIRLISYMASFPAILTSFDNIGTMWICYLFLFSECSFYLIGELIEVTKNINEKLTALHQPKK